MLHTSGTVYLTSSLAGPSARFWLGGSMPYCRLRRRNFFSSKFDYEMVHSEVYLNKYVVSIAPFSTSACPDYNINIENCFFPCFRFSIFHPFFQEGSANPICPYVRTPMITDNLNVTANTFEMKLKTFYYTNCYP